MTEEEMMRKYAEAHGYGADVCTRPLPVVRVGDKLVKNMLIKAYFAKINEELDELKEAVLENVRSNQKPEAWTGSGIHAEVVAEEAADTITAITTMLEALGIDEEMRNEAQRRVNDKNRERGRL